MSLDETIPTFQFCSSEPDSILFEVPESAACLSGLFDSMLKSDSSKLIHLNPVTHIADWPVRRNYQINTNKLLNYVYKYFILWSKTPSSANYVEQKPVQTGDVTQFLKPIDIEFINLYLIETSNVDWIDKTRYNVEPTYTRYINNSLLGELLTQVDEFLNIESLSNKIYAYIAAGIWNSSLVDFQNATQDPIFKKLQEDALADWKEQHTERISQHVLKDLVDEEVADVDDAAEDDIIVSDDPFGL